MMTDERFASRQMTFNHLRLDPPRQSDILRRQLRHVNERTSYRHNAALMLLWHAAFYPEAYEAVAEECAELTDRPEGEDLSVWGTRLDVLPLELAARIDDINRLGAIDVPRTLTFGLWAEQSWVRDWVRTCAYWASPYIFAADLLASCRHVRELHFIDPDLPQLVAVCRDGFDALCRLRDEFPDWRAVDDMITRTAIGERCWNGFAPQVIELLSYMLRETMRAVDGTVGFWDELLREADGFEGTAALVRTLLLDARVGPLQAGWLDPRKLQEAQRDSGPEAHQVRCPVWIGGAWYRLMEYPDGKLIVESRDDRDCWSEASMPPGRFIEAMLNAKEVGT